MTVAIADFATRSKLPTNTFFATAPELTFDEVPEQLVMSKPNINSTDSHHGKRDRRKKQSHQALSSKEALL